MRVEGNGTGVIDWRLRGMIGLAPIDADFESRYTLNVLTGRIEQHSCVADPVPVQRPAGLELFAARTVPSHRVTALCSSDGAAVLM